MRYRAALIRTLIALAAALAIRPVPGQTTPAVTATPAQLSFTYQPGQAALPAAQTVTLKASTAGANYTVSITGVNTQWLTATPTTGKLNATLTVRANPTSMAVGSYTATISVAVSGVAQPITLPVTLQVTTPAPTVTLSSTTLAFTAPPAQPLAQLVRLSTSGSPVSFTTAVTGAPWLTVTPASGVILPGSPATITIAVDASLLAPQSAPYTGRITIAAPQAAQASRQQVINVALTVNAVQPTLSSLWPTGVFVNAAATTVTIRGAGFFAGSVGKVQGVATPLQTTVLGPDTLLAVLPATLLNTASTLQVFVTNPAPGGDSAPLAFTVGNTPTIQAIVNAASMQTGAGSPGELITMFGADIGPSSPVYSADGNNDGFLDTTVNSVAVTVDGIAAPLIYASQNQVTVQIPFEATTGANKPVVINKGSGSPATGTMTIATVAPGLFSLDGSGTGQAVALNYNTTTSSYSVNEVKNPAKPGDTIVLYVTGEGDWATSFPTRTGWIFPSSVSPLPQLSPLPTVTIGGSPASVSYAGPSVGSVLGLLQINCVIPAGLSANNATPIVVTIAGANTQSGSTIAVKP
jgi:trimeric autotransporter adhesin